jgi:hypothetical protein
MLYTSVQCIGNTINTQITLKNKSSFNLTDKLILIPRSKIKYLPVNSSLYPLLISSTGDSIAVQLNDLDKDQTWDELVFTANLAAKKTLKLTLKWVSEKPKFIVRTSVRFGKRMSADDKVEPATTETLTAKELPKSLGFQKYQTDGPTWENDKVGFRHYLDGRNSKDLFGKRSPTISPENVGINSKSAVEDNYHVMAEWGRDILAVGNSLGIGGYGLEVSNRLLRLGVTSTDSTNNIEKTTFTITNEGPVYSALNYSYQNWKIAERTYNAEENTSIWPSFYGYKNSIKIWGLKGDENLVVGLVNINTENELKEIRDNDKYIILYTHDKQTYNNEWWLGLALIIPKNLYLGFEEGPKTGQISNTFLAKLKIENNKMVNYYAVACWEISDKRFKDEDFFTGYLKDLTNQLSAKVEVKIN